MFSSVPNPAKKLNRFVLAGLLPGPDINPRLFGRVVPGPRFHFTVPATFAPIKYLSSDHIMIWPVRRLCSTSRSFTFHFQICDPTDIRWVAVKSRHILGEISGLSIATQRILVGSQIWKREVKERLELHNLHTDHVMIPSELKYFIAARYLGLQSPGFEVDTGPNTNGPGFSCDTPHCHGSGPVPTRTRNRYSRFKLLLTLVLPQSDNPCKCLPLLIQHPQLLSYYRLVSCCEIEVCPTHFGCSYEHIEIWWILEFKLHFCALIIAHFCIHVENIQMIRKKLCAQPHWIANLTWQRTK